MKRNNLTKENFWNKIEGKYPLSFANFSLWVDLWKISNKTDTWISYALDQPIGSIKFHHYPYPMQFGVFCQYLEDMELMEEDFNYFSINLDEYIEETFILLEMRLKLKQQNHEKA